MKVLLAQDNSDDRKLATRLLEEHGHTVVVTESGLAALEAVDRDAIDVALMEVQILPARDEFAAIGTIRAKEQSSGAHLPIIALTAPTIAGGREKCLRAGAGAQLAMPIRMKVLLTALDRVKNLLSRHSSPEPSAKTGSLSTWDMESALDRVEGDRELLKELAELFASEYARSGAEIRRALEAND